MIQSGSKKLNDQGNNLWADRHTTEHTFGRIATTVGARCGGLSVSESTDPLRYSQGTWHSLKT